MSGGFLRFLRCIFCCQDEEYESDLVDVLISSGFRNRTRENPGVPDYHRTSSSSPTHHQSSNLTQNYQPNYPNISKFPIQIRQESNVSKTSSTITHVQTGGNPIATKPTQGSGFQHFQSGGTKVLGKIPDLKPEASKSTSEKPSVFLPSSAITHVQTGGNSIATKSTQGSGFQHFQSGGTKVLGKTPDLKPEASKSTSEKPSVLLPSSAASTHGISNKTIKSDTKKTSEPKVLPNVPPVSPSPSFKTISSSVTSQNLSSASDKPTISPKSSRISQKPAHVYVRTTTDPAANVKTEQTFYPISSRPSVSKAAPSSPKPSSSSTSGTPPSTPRKASSSSLSTKRTLAPAMANSRKDHMKNEYVWVDKGGTSLTYVIPEEIKDLIKIDQVPAVLKKPLSPSTYKDYFAALLNAEDFYFERWDGFEMENVTLDLHEAAIYNRKGKNTKPRNYDDKDDKFFVAFELDSIPQRRPYLLSKDFVFVWPSGSEIEPFQGILYRVVRRNLVLADFDEDFHYQHYPSCKYNIKFSFNRVCLKRAHQAVEAASNMLFRNFLFPESVPTNRLIPTQLCLSKKLKYEQATAVQQILSLHSAPPYIIEGPLSVIKRNLPTGMEEGVSKITETGAIIQEAILQIYQTYRSSRILICAPSNNTCDMLMRGLKKIPESDMFRANAAFREREDVPYDIFVTSCYEGECFVFPSFSELQRYRVISSTFMSSFRLHNEGLKAGHFSHIFLVDSSSVIEPEALVPLANLANEKTVIVITGEVGDSSRWVRSNIARQKGLTVSYFERLCKSNLYESGDPDFITQLEDTS